MSSTAEDFDPYYTWLGIRPEEQPPDHYRLIGLKQFEDNADVIANAMDRQMQFLRSMQVGKRSAQSQKLLNEISAAGGCLLDPSRKSAYDKELKAKEAAKAKPAPAKARPLVKATPLVAPLPEPDLFSVPMPQRAYSAPAQAAPQQKHQQNPSYLPLILAGAAGGVVLLLLVVIVSGRMFSGGKSAVAKVDKGPMGTVQKEDQPSKVTAIKKSSGTAPEQTEKTPDSETVKPVSAPPADSAKANAWQYGVGAFDEQSKRTIDFLPLRHWTGDAWQMSRELPDPERGWVLVNALGGNSGTTQKDSAIRRWTAPQGGKLSVSGQLKHLPKGGDGIRGRIVSSRTGVLGEWKLRNSATQTPVNSVDVQVGDHIDFIVDCVDDDTYDFFYWQAALRLTDAQGKELGTWNSEADFHGPLPGQMLASSGGPESPATPPLKLPRLPRDPYWKPPGDKGQTKFSAFLGTYSHRDHRDKPYPVVNLQVPANNLWTKEIQQKVQGKIPFEEITYRGLARVNITMEGVYVVDTHPNARFDIYSQKVSGHGEVKLPRGEQNISIEIGSHGGPFLAECSLSMHNKATGEEVQFFSYWEEIQKFLATPIEGQPVTEISGWRPTEESDLRGPMYWWDFDVTSTETADDVEKRFNMKLANWKADEPRLVPGKVGNAVRFHRPEHWGGTWSFTDFPHLTVVFWLKALKEERGNQQILAPWVALNYGKRAGIGVLGMVMEPQRPELGKWYHYAVAINQETKQVHIYRDGAEVASGRLGNYESQSNSRYWALGHNHDLENHSETLRGELDEMRIYDRLLSQDEVKQVIAIDLARGANAPITLPALAGSSPSADGQAAFRSFLGTYMYFLDRQRAHPIVNLQVPKGNLWTRELEAKYRDQVSSEEISYVGRARIVVPEEGTYALGIHRGYARIFIDGVAAGGDFDQDKQDVKISRGAHVLTLEIHTHGSSYLQDTAHISLKNKETGKELEFFNTWQDIQEFLATPIRGRPVKEISGWQPTAENQLTIDPQYLAAVEVKHPVTDLRLVGWNSRDPNWKPASRGPFFAFLGYYRYGNDPAKPYPFVNLQVPSKNLWTQEIQDKLRGKIPFDEISYSGTAKIAIPADGTYVLTTEKSARVHIDGQVVADWDTVKGEIKIAKGVHNLTLEVGSHGGNWMRECPFALRHKETSQEVQPYNSWPDIQKFLGTPIGGQGVTEVSGWLPAPNNELRDYDKLLVSAGLNRPEVPAPAVTPKPPASPPKVALPDAAAVAAARQEVARLFRDDLKAAKTPQARQELARKMLEIAKATSDRTEKYAMLEEIRKLAEEIKSAALAATVLDLEEADFGVDALAEKVKLLEKLAGGTMTPAQRSEIVSTAMGFGDVALSAGKTESLPALTAVIRSLASKGVSPDRKTEALDFVESLAQRQQDAAALRQAEQKLASSPDDPEANLIMGLYYCFTVKEDLKGLPLLVKGKDSNFALAAKDRLAVTSTSTLCSLAGANAWADAAPAAPAEYKWRVEKRALQYYQWLLANSKGLDKIEVQKRHDKVLADIVATLKQSQLPRATPGLVGRVQVDGKDAGIVVTSRPPGDLREERLAAILAQAKGRRARMVLAGTFHCDEPGEFRVFHVGREGGPSQAILLDGKPFSQAGGTHGNGGEQRGNVGAGDHVLQWTCEFDLSVKPRLDLSFGPTPQDQKRLEIYASQRQLFEAWKLGTKLDIEVSEY